MPTRQQVTDWQTSRLSQWADEIESQTVGYESQLTRVVAHFSGTAWSGRAYEAAADRFTEENDQGRRLSQELREAAAILRNADGRLAAERAALLARAQDAEGDRESPVPLTVDGNKWVVSVTATGFHLSGDDKEKVKERVLHHQGLINSAYYSLQNAVSEMANALTVAAQEIRARGDLFGDGVDAPTPTAGDSAALGREDGQALAEWAKPIEAHRDPSILAQVASQLPQHPLTDEQLRILSEGGEVDSLPASVQEYYRELYKAGGKEGILGLSEYLKEQEESGNTEAAAQLDSLANGLLVVSNEDIGTGRDQDGNLTGAGGYSHVPEEFRQLLEARRDDPNPVGLEPGDNPHTAMQQQWQDTNALASLLGEGNPGYEPGTELGTQMYLKSSDLVQDQSHWDGRDDAAATFAGIAGRNNDSAHQIWTGEGLGEDYNPQETVRSLTTYDWSETDNGAGAATLIDRITEESQLPADTPEGQRGREALADLGQMLASDDVWQQHADNFVDNPELSTAVSKAMSANLDAVSTYGQPHGYTSTDVFRDGRVVIEAETANRLLQLGSYSEDGRIGLTTAAELHRIEELSQAMSREPGKLQDILAGSDAAPLASRIDQAMWNSLIHEDQLKEDAALNPDSALYKAKMMGAALAGGLTEEAMGKVPGAQTGTGLIGLDVGGAVEGAIQDWIAPDYDAMELPSEATLKAQGVENAQNAILQAAYLSGQLPPELGSGSGPYDMSVILSDPQSFEQFSRFMADRGLNTYVTEYSQFYSVNVGEGAK